MLKVMDQRVQWFIISLELEMVLRVILDALVLSVSRTKWALLVCPARKTQQLSDAMNSSLNPSSAFCPCAHVYSDLHAHALRSWLKTEYWGIWGDSSGCSTAVLCYYYSPGVGFRVRVSLEGLPIVLHWRVWPVVVVVSTHPNSSDIFDFAFFILCPLCTL